MSTAQLSAEDKATLVGYDAALRDLERLLREKKARFDRLGHPAATNESRLLEGILQEMGLMVYNPG